MTRIAALVAGVATVVLLAGTWWFTRQGASEDPFAACRTAQISGGTGAIGGPFTLVDGAGRTVSDADVLTRPSLVYFGYTFCPDVCPVDNARNADAVDLAAEGGVDAQAVFITVDPARDTPAVMGDYASNMSPRMIGLSGTPEQTTAAANAYRVYFKINKGDPQYYLVDHSTFTYLVLPGFGVVDFYRRDATAEDIAASLRCYAEAAAPN